MKNSRTSHAGIDLAAADYEITYSHDVSTKQVKDFPYDHNGRLHVAFVSDETRNTLHDSRLIAIRSGPMTTKILQDVLLLTPDFIQREPAAVENVKRLLRSTRGRTFNLSTPDEWWKEYEEIKGWIAELGGNNVLLSNTLTIDQIITRINNYNRHHATEPARVALVLSGGGAKCAYQLGAVEVIEDRLEAAQRANPSQKLGIDLVVGTSGGAINALTIAAEVTKDVNRRPKLVSTWQGFGQSEILKPSNFVRRLLGLAAGLILSLCVLRSRGGIQPAKSALGRARLIDLRPLPVSRFIARRTWSEICASQSRSTARSRDGHGVTFGNTPGVRVLPNLFLGKGSVCFRRYRRQDVQRDAATARHRSGIQSLPEISKDIIDQEVIKRDLVITGSMLQTPSGSASMIQPFTHDDTDLYFVYKVGPNPQLPQKLQKDNRFVSLRDPDNAPILLDAVIGSGSIFPAFEPRQLGGVKRIMDKAVTREVAIIDGGFVHNSPIEAAVKLDATHIIVIEASPASRPNEQVNLLNNSVAAFNHLFTQAQLLDARSRRQAEIYTLQPSSPAADGAPFLCTLDFGKNFIDRAIKWGNDDARDIRTPRFVRQPRPSGL